MKNLIHLLSFVFLTTISITAQDLASVSSEIAPLSESCTLTVEFTNVKSEKGQIIVGLYDSEKNWLKTNIKGQVTKIENGIATVIFENVPYGDYGISSIHDEDMDGKLKTGMFGIPREPYASSRGAKGRFGPPKWKDAVFTLSTKTSKETIKF